MMDDDEYGDEGSTSKQILWWLYPVWALLHESGLRRCNVISLKYHLKTFTAMKRTIRNWSEYNAGLK
ncbi:MAG: hypothetical protein VKJ24_09725, partial [Synechococcales bacterium]|nr:hypothetical protein [Synechococcales bacterium]